jgi:OFA family oxalate/formate antiporter-like MFS transporter
MLYVAAAISGVGAGAVYGTCVGNALKWFPDRRGLTAGLTAAGFGAGAAATVVPIRAVILAYGYETAFLWFGLGQGLIVMILSQLLRAPKPGEAPAAVRCASRCGTTARSRCCVRRSSICSTSCL